MFGLVTPCRHSLPERLREVWTAHLCGLCLTLRDRHGHAARLATNVDAVLVSVLVAAQRPGLAPTRRAAGCALRGLRTATVVTSDAPAARLAAGVSLALAGGVVTDHGADGDLPRAMRPAAARIGRAWERRGMSEIAGLGLGSRALAGVAARQAQAEAHGTSLLAVTVAAEEAAAEAFAHTAALAGRPGNAAALADAGRLVGRVAHLTDALVDQADDDRHGRWNPLTATGTPVPAARAAVEDALAGTGRAVARLELPGTLPGASPQSRLHAELAGHLLTEVLPRSVRRMLARAGHRIAPACATHSPGAGGETPAWGTPGAAGLAAGAAAGIAAGELAAHEQRRGRWRDWCDCDCSCCDCCECVRCCPDDGCCNSCDCCGSCDCCDCCSCCDC